MSQPLSRIQHINDNAHDCINNGKQCIFGDGTGNSDLVQGLAEWPQHSVDQTPILLLVAAGEKERVKDARGTMTALLESQEVGRNSKLHTVERVCS